jgi:hypothetical protein
MPDRTRKKGDKYTTVSKKSRGRSRYNNDICNESMTFEECELAIVHHAVDESENIKGAKLVNNEEVIKMLKIVENFIIQKKLVCYGGTAINNILPKYAQFYNRDLEIPDYDFFSPNALNDAIELADIYHAAGYTDVEAKSGIHYGTFKVFVNFIPIADITLLNKQIFDAISKDSIKIANIRYAPPNYLRMGMYLELSRPAGDVSRWEKVFKRLTLLNKFYPLTTTKECNTVDFAKNIEVDSPDIERQHVIIRDALVDNSVIFFGGYSTHLYSTYMNKNDEQLVKRIPDFDVIIDDPDKCALILKERLIENEFKNIKIISHDAIGEIIPRHVELVVGKHSMVFLYEPIACHSYNQIVVDKATVNVATIETILAFYLSFIYADMPHYDKDRLLCIAEFLFDVQRKHKLSQHGILKRFSINCYGKQQTLDDIRSEKASKHKLLQHKKNTKEYKMWFLRYNPENPTKNDMNKKPKSSTNTKTRKAAAPESPGIITKLFGL